VGELGDDGQREEAYVGRVLRREQMSKAQDARLRPGLEE
jgi:hypothetical protein